MLGQNLFNPTNAKIDWKLLLGAFCFGLGWGIGGLCPGPAIMQFSIFTLQIQVVWFGCVVVGMYLAKFLDAYTTKREKGLLAEKEKYDNIPEESPKRPVAVNMQDKLMT